MGAFVACGAGASVTLRRLLSLEIGATVTIRCEGPTVGGEDARDLSDVLDGPLDDSQWTHAEAELTTRMLEGSVRHVTASEVRYTTTRLVLLERCHLLLGIHAQRQQQRQQGAGNVASQEAATEGDAQLRDALYDTLTGYLWADGQWAYLRQRLRAWSPEAAQALVADGRRKAARRCDAGAPALQQQQTQAVASSAAAEAAMAAAGAATMAAAGAAAGAGAVAAAGAAAGAAAAMAAGAAAVMAAGAAAVAAAGAASPAMADEPQVVVPPLPEPLPDTEEHSCPSQSQRQSPSQSQTELLPPQHSEPQTCPQAQTLAERQQHLGPQQRPGAMQQQEEQQQAQQTTIRTWVKAEPTDECMDSDPVPTCPAPADNPPALAPLAMPAGTVSHPAPIPDVTPSRGGTRPMLPEEGCTGGDAGLVTQGAVTQGAAVGDAAASVPAPQLKADPGATVGLPIGPFSVLGPVPSSAEPSTRAPSVALELREAEALVSKQAHKVRPALGALRSLPDQARAAEPQVAEPARPAGQSQPEGPSDVPRSGSSGPEGGVLAGDPGPALAGAASVSAAPQGPLRQVSEELPSHLRPQHRQEGGDTVPRVGVITSSPSKTETDGDRAPASASSPEADLPARVGGLQQHRQQESQKCPAPPPENPPPQTVPPQPQLPPPHASQTTTQRDGQHSERAPRQQEQLQAQPQPQPENAPAPVPAAGRVAPPAARASLPTWMRPSSRDLIAGRNPSSATSTLAAQSSAGQRALPATHRQPGVSLDAPVAAAAAAAAAAPRETAPVEAPSSGAPAAAAAAAAETTVPGGALALGSQATEQPGIRSRAAGDKDNQPPRPSEDRREPLQQTQVQAPPNRCARSAGSGTGAFRAIFGVGLRRVSEPILAGNAEATAAVAAGVPGAPSLGGDAVGGVSGPVATMQALDRAEDTSGGAKQPVVVSEQQKLASGAAPSLRPAVASVPASAAALTHVRLPPAAPAPAPAAAPPPQPPPPYPYAHPATAAPPVAASGGAPQGAMPWPRKAAPASGGATFNALTLIESLSAPAATRREPVLTVPPLSFGLMRAASAGAAAAAAAAAAPPTGLDGALSPPAAGAPPAAAGGPSAAPAGAAYRRELLKSLSATMAELRARVATEQQGAQDSQGRQNPEQHPWQQPGYGVDASGGDYDAGDEEAYSDGYRTGSCDGRDGYDDGEDDMQVDSPAAAGLASAAALAPSPAPGAGGAAGKRRVRRAGRANRQRWARSAQGRMIAWARWAKRVNTFLRQRPGKTATYADVVNAGFGIPPSVADPGDYHAVTGYLREPRNRKYFRVMRQCKKDSGLFCVLKAAFENKAGGGVPGGAPVAKDAGGAAVGDGGDDGDGGGGGWHGAAGTGGGSGDGLAAAVAAAPTVAAAATENGGVGGLWSVAYAAASAAAALIDAGGVAPPAAAAVAAQTRESELSYMRRLYDYLLSQPGGVVTRELIGTPVRVPKHLLAASGLTFGKWIAQRTQHWSFKGNRLVAKPGCRP